jgi:hypothetical protein
MASNPDTRGIHQFYYKESIGQDLFKILVEDPANDKHNEDTSSTKFIYSRFTIKGSRHLIIGYNKFRTKDSVEKEHTAFKYNENSENDGAKNASRGCGAKLPQYRIGGYYGILFQGAPDTEFTRDITKWNFRDWVDMSELTHKIKLNEEFTPEDYNPRIYTPANKKKDIGTFFNTDEYVNTELDKFIMDHNFKYFKIYTDYNDDIESDINIALNIMPNMFPDIAFYSSIDFKKPQKVIPNTTFGLSPSQWIGGFAVHWRIGEIDTTTQKYYKSTFCIKPYSSNIEQYGKLESNGDKSIKFNRRYASFKPSNENEKKSNIIVDVGLLTKEEHSLHIQKTEAKDQNQLYIVIDGHVISFYPFPEIRKYLTAAGIEPSRIRLKLTILEESIKCNKNAGINITAVKFNSRIIEDKAIYECVHRSLHLFDKYISSLLKINPDITVEMFNTNINNIKDIIEKDKEQHKKRNKRKKEGIQFEGRVAENIKELLSEITINDIPYTIKWEDKDSLISADNNLEGEGIDLLGTLSLPDKKIYIAAQMKDRESGVPKKEIKKFTDTLQSFKDKHLKNDDKIIALLTLAKEASFNYETYSELIKKNIITIVERGKAGDESIKIIETQLENLI